MAPFIRFTLETQEAKGVRRQLTFVNLDHVAKVVYDDQDASLSIIMADRSSPSGKAQVMRLTGSEAQEALKVIREAT